MNRSQTKRKRSALAKLKRIDLLLLEINERMAPVNDDTAHVPRTKPLPRGRVSTVFSQCDETCPACALARKYNRQKMRLRPIQQAALTENARSRDASVQALDRSRAKITMQGYLDAGKKARLRKELAILLKVTDEGLRRWEKRNHIKWDKNNGLIHSVGKK